MFQTRYNTSLDTIVHESDGYFTWEELLAAANNATTPEHEKSTTIWDFRKSGSISPDLEAFYAAKSAFQNRSVGNCTRHHAFVVADAKEAARVADMLRKLPLPGFWVVKIEMDEALAWVAEA